MLRVFLLFALIFSPAVRAWPEYSAALALGFSLQQFKDDEADGEERDSMLTNVVYANGAVEWLPGVSTGVGFWLWGNGDRNENATVAEFDGVSASWDITLRLPLAQGQGPYVRYGRHCWAAAVSGLLDPWSEDGCSMMKGGGFNFVIQDRSRTVLYVEYIATDFREIETDSLIAGVRGWF